MRAGNNHEPQTRVDVTKIPTEGQTPALRRHGDPITPLCYRHVDFDGRDEETPDNAATDDEDDHTDNVDRYTSHVIFLMHVCIVCIPVAWLKTSQGSTCLRCAFQFQPHAIHDVTCLSVRLLCLRFCLLSLLSLPLLPCFSFTVYLFSARHTIFHNVVIRRGLKPAALTHNEEYCPVAIHNPLTCCEPKLLDNFDH